MKHLHVFYVRIIVVVSNGSRFVESRYTFLQSFYGVSVVVRK